MKDRFRKGSTSGHPERVFKWLAASPLCLFQGLYWEEGIEEGLAKGGAGVRVIFWRHQIGTPRDLCNRLRGAGQLPSV